MRSAFKNGVGIFGILLLLAIVAGSALFFYQCFKPKQAVIDHKAIKDSIAHYTDLKNLHNDSANFYQHKYEEYTIKSDSLDAADSISLVRMRATYRADWERKNGY